MKRLSALAAVLCVLLCVSLALADAEDSVRITDFIKIQSMTEDGHYGILTISPTSEAANQLAMDAFLISLEGEMPTAVFTEETQEALKELIPDARFEMHEIVGVGASGYLAEMGVCWVTMRFVGDYRTDCAVVVRTEAEGEFTETVLAAEPDPYGRVLSTFPIDVMEAIRDADSAVIAVVSRGN